MDTHILQLGAGRMGRIMATDLANDYEITVADLKLPKDLWEDEVQMVKADLEDYDKLKSLINDHDFVVGALPAELSYRAMFAAVECGKNFVDVSYMAEDPTPLENLAKEKKVTGLVDCGLAPGLTNLIVGEALSRDSHIHQAKLMVGGMAADRHVPYGYRITWSPRDLLAEYTRPARAIDNGRVITLPALSGCEEVILTGVGVLEAFLTDGLRTLLHLENVDYMVEKTMRWPGHVKAVQPLIESGDLVEELTTHCSEGDDLVVLHCEIDGTTWTMVERPKHGMTAMQRTTALTCAQFVRLAIEANDQLPYGVLPPEKLGDFYDFIVAQLAEYDINLEEK